MNELTRPAPSPDQSLDANLDRLASVAIRVGANLSPGQELVVTAPIEALPLVRRITAHAYAAGCKLVTPLYADDEGRLARFRDAPDDAFDYAPAWLHEGIARAYREGAARLAIAGEDPALLAGVDPDRVARAARAQSRAGKPAMVEITNFRTNWTIVPFATSGWSRAVFPDLAPAEAGARLWDAIFAACRIDAADPLAAWAAHNDALHARTARLNAQCFDALRFTGPGTDLTVGLSDGHLWVGGSKTATNGITCNANLPTEEVFTTPHAPKTEGIVRATKPLSHGGTLIRDIAVRFEGGRIVDARASTGEHVLKRVLETDEGAARLGEVALVPHSSPIAQSGLLFNNTLFDENAASHIALGQAYSACLAGGTEMSTDELVRRGANQSLIHIDWMIGSDQVDVDGLRADGTAEPVMRGGEWV
jgi:aminopeptidase